MKIVKNYADFRKTVLLPIQKDQLVVAYYSAPWCPNCKTMNSFVFLLQQDFPDVCFVKVEVVDNAIDICKERSIVNFPCFEYFKNGKSLTVLTEPDIKKVSVYVERLRHSTLGQRWIYNLLPDNWMVHWILQTILIITFAFHCYNMYTWYFPDGRNQWLITVIALVFAKKVLEIFWIKNRIK